ncbi:MAG: hypothetical protein HGB15_09120 [Chlorobaculum sp.]|nr:hypothetical protein [Chlorobaculum sp.]
MESDEYIVFHGTAFNNLQSILEKGFLIPKEGILNSVSFAKNNSASMGYACDKRSVLSPKGVVIAIKIKDLQAKNIRIESSHVHIFGDKGCYVTPEIGGYSIYAYCIVPASYRYH